MQLVVFDFDETLTLVTFMTNENDSAAERQYLTTVNFETPWVQGCRVDKLRTMLQALAEGRDGRRRALAILTKNSNKNGIKGVLTLLQDADLASLFDALWIMPHRFGQPGGAYQEGGQWNFFDPPLHKVASFKADVLCHVAANAGEWFPQLQGQVESDRQRLQLLLKDLRPEGIVLVDDQRANFQSPSGSQVMRYCKVARYDAPYRELGDLRDMGGIGAHNDADYEALRRFVEDPWMCRENLQVRCSERAFDGDADKHPVKLVVFDFDETLTLASFVPQDPACGQVVDWTPTDSENPEWTEADLITYNFESPYVQGSRVAKLCQLFKGLIDEGRQNRMLAILTMNEYGVIAVLNLLKIAKMDMYFSAIWTMQIRAGRRSGVYQASGGWTGFDPPVAEVHHHKADVLAHVVSDPTAWFPQLLGDEANALQELKPEGVVLVDDERANFRSNSPSETKVLRYCKVARYDEIYRDCGPLNQMGGIGAHSDEDYDMLKNFVERPWEFPYEPSPGAADKTMDRAFSVGHERIGESEEQRKAPRSRSRHMLKGLFSS